MFAMSSSASLSSIGKVSSSTIEVVADVRIFMNVWSGMVEVEDHRRVVGRLDGAVGQGRVVGVTVADRAEQHRGAVGVGDLDVALEREQHVRGGELVAVGERGTLGSVQVMVCGSSYAHDSARSGSGSEPLAGTVISCWKMLYWMFHEPKS